MSYLLVNNESNDKSRYVRTESYIFSYMIKQIKALNIMNT